RRSAASLLAICQTVSSSSFATQSARLPGFLTESARRSQFIGLNRMSKHLDASAALASLGGGCIYRLVSRRKLAVPLLVLPLLLLLWGCSEYQRFDSVGHLRSELAGRVEGSSASSIEVP